VGKVVVVVVVDIVDVVELVIGVVEVVVVVMVGIEVEVEVEVEGGIVVIGMIGVKVEVVGIIGVVDVVTSVVGVVVVLCTAQHAVLTKPRQSFGVVEQCSPILRQSCSSCQILCAPHNCTISLLQRKDPTAGHASVGPVGGIVGEGVGVGDGVGAGVDVDATQQAVLTNPAQSPGAVEQCSLIAVHD
jgi:hypothetical protein